MNIYAKIKAERPHWRQPAAPTRRRFTSTDVLAMDEAGVLHPEERVELIDGEIFTMPAKAARHDDLCAILAERLRKAGGDLIRVNEEKALRLSENWVPEPDIALSTSQLKPSEVRGPSALLVIEVAYSTLSFDLDIKAPMYAAHGVRDYWVIDAKCLVTHVHREPGSEGYGSVQEVSADQLVGPLLLPDIALKLADLDFEPLADDPDGEAAAKGT